MSDEHHNNAPHESVQITLRMKNEEDLTASIGWNFSPEMDEDTLIQLRRIGEGLMFLLSQQIEDVIQIGVNLEESIEDEDLEHEGTIIPFPTTPTKH
jgi:hypothetical protein